MNAIVVSQKQLEEVLGCSRGRPEVVVQPATIPPVPLERPPVPNICHRAAPGDRLSKTLCLLGLRGGPIDMMGASNMLGGNLGCGSVRPPPDGPSSKRDLLQVISGTWY